MVKKRTVLLYPHIGENSGTGHIKRLLKFYNDERYNGLFIHGDYELLSKTLESFNIESDNIIPIDSIKSISSIDFIVVDNRETDLYTYNYIKNIAPIVAIDEGGFLRNYAEYSVDILPNLLESKPNISSLSFLELDKLELKKVVEVKNILVTFGGQDPYNLTEDCVAKLRGKYNVTTIIGPLFKTKDFGVEKIESPKSLKDIIPKYDLVITSFGLTPFESISYGTPVALVNPTDYHRSLSKKAGFHQLGDNLGINIKKIIKDCSKIQIEEPKSITDFLYSMEFTNNPCPVCLRKNGGVIERYRNKTYFNCDHCKMDYLNNHTEEIVYSEDYFFTDYKKQYGKTYLEDFDHIKNMGFSRLKSILKKAKKGSTILDIGCAYGPFLSAAEDVGLIPKGIDISKDATDYVNKTLGIEAYPSAFPIKTELFKYLDIITMWFVIEHFKNINDVLIQINRLLKKGGVFAFSTPNAKGISGVKNYYNFLDNSPNDHFTLWNKKNSINVLRQFGFKVYKINVTGHHPERFTRLSKNRVIFKIVNLISKVLGLGDTFEVYCVKERNL